MNVKADSKVGNLLVRVWGVWGVWGGWGGGGGGCGVMILWDAMIPLIPLVDYNKTWVVKADKKVGVLRPTALYNQPREPNRNGIIA